MHEERRRSRLTALALAAALTVALPGAAHADPPRALPGAATSDELKWQPAFDYDGDGCYPTPAIGPDGTLNPGLKPSGALNGNCRDAADLDNTNTYSRAKCNNGWCAYMYDLYFEKDQAVPLIESGHRHDIEHVVVWVQDNSARYVSTSAHGNYTTRPANQVAWEGSHAKIVYHKDGVLTHAFRHASATEPPENHKGAWQYPPLVGWNHYPPGIRDRLVQADFGSAGFGLKDSAFGGQLERAKPSGIPFNPHG
ncbi:NPP1 family protein [Allokutzneria albata]|uniref:NPP1 family protein n=1 Tax=Allokutzneria albata TaxID=211114 RepID=UPI0004C3A612|nr:NPP1 family protein [Allokutzneria albata]